MASTPKSRRTIDAIVRAAHDEFSEVGPEGARIDRIATGAGVNKQRIYAYFGSKEGLFTEVLSRAFAQLVAAVPIPQDVAGLKSYAGEVFDYHRKDPTLIRLLAWEGLHYRQHALDTDYSRAAYYQNSIANLAKSVGADAKTVSRVVLTIVGLASWPHVVPQQRRLLTVGAELENREDLDALRSTVAIAGQAIAASLLEPAGS